MLDPREALALALSDEAREIEARRQRLHIGYSDGDHYWSPEEKPMTSRTEGKQAVVNGLMLIRAKKFREAQSAALTEEESIRLKRKAARDRGIIILGGM